MYLRPRVLKCISSLTHVFQCSGSKRPPSATQDLAREKALFEQFDCLDAYLLPFQHQVNSKAWLVKSWVKGNQKIP